MGCWCSFRLPRVPRRETPSRPSGADKQQQRAQNEGGRGIGLGGRPLDRADGLPRRHCQSQPSCSTAKLAEQGKVRVNRASVAELLAESGDMNQASRPLRSALLSFTGCTLIASIRSRSFVLAARRAPEVCFMALPSKKEGDGAPFGAAIPDVRALLPVHGASRRAVAAFSFGAGSALSASRLVPPPALGRRPLLGGPCPSSLGRTSTVHRQRAPRGGS